MNGRLPLFPKFCEPWLDQFKASPALAEALCSELSAVAARVLTHELAKWKETGSLVGATPAERWGHFSDVILALPQVRARLEAESPLLAPLLDRVTEHFALNLERAVSRVEGREIALIEPNLSEPHANGQTVLRFEFSDGQKLIYKPRSVAGEVWWQAFVTWWNASGIGAVMELRAPQVLDFGDFGFCEFIETCDPKEPETVSAWFFRQGVQTAITWLFGIEDCHFENFVNAEGLPILVDAECVGAAFWRPTPPGFLEPPIGLPVALTPIQETGLVGGMLPGWIFPKLPDQPLFVTPGLSGVADRPIPVKRPRWTGLGTDELRLELASGVFSKPPSPTPTSTSAREIAQGFHAATAHLFKHRQEILGWIGPANALDPIRVRPRILFRNTTAYQQILEATTGRKFLHSNEVRRAALSTVATHAVIGGVEPEGLLDAELHFLERQTYPRFSVNSEGTQIVADGSEQSLVACDPTSAADRMRTRWDRLTPEAIRWQSALVEASCRQAEEQKHVFAPGPQSYLQAALEIGKALERQAIRTPQGIGWLGLQTNPDGGVVPQLPGGDFHSGSAGVAAFLAQLAQATGEECFSALALEALSYSDHFWKSVSHFDAAIPWSAMHGAGSILLAAGTNDWFLRNDQVRRLAEEWLEKASSDPAWLELDGDFMNGLPGVAAALASLAEIPKARQLLAPTLERLLDPRISSNFRLPGMAHGTSGWLAGVIAASRVLEDDQGMKIAKERIQALPSEWAEFEALESIRDNLPAGWCNGAIGLASVASSHPETLDVAQFFVEKARPFFGSGVGGHHLCCGEAGRAQILVRVADQLDERHGIAEAAICLDALLEHGREKGFLYLNGIPERFTLPGWMSGISGIGSALLDIQKNHRSSDK